MVCFICRSFWDVIRLTHIIKACMLHEVTLVSKLRSCFRLTEHSLELCRVKLFTPLFASGERATPAPETSCPCLGDLILFLQIGWKSYEFLMILQRGPWIIVDIKFLQLSIVCASKCVTCVTVWQSQDQTRGKRKLTASHVLMKHIRTSLI